MGVILEPTPDMAPWSTEVRSKSAYIAGGEVRAHRTEGADLHTGFAVRLDQARGLIAALDQILNRRWTVPLASPPADHVAATWTIAETDEGWFELTGPCYVYGAQAGTGWVQSTAFTDAERAGTGVFELAHWDIQEVRNRLADSIATIADRANGPEVASP